MRKTKSVGQFEIVRMNDISIIAAICCSMLLVACGEGEGIFAARQDEADCKKAVTSSLKDPDSAKFGEFSIVTPVPGMKTACLTVNARNSLGGYVGNRQASLLKIDGKWLVAGMGMEPVDHAECKFSLERILGTGKITDLNASEKRRLGWPDPNLYVH